jgi:hypothetical protein
MAKRIIFSIVLIILAFVAPWWIGFILALAGLFYFKGLYEVIAVGIILDSLYGASFSIFGFNFVFTAFFLIAFYIISTFKKNLLI